MKKSLFSIFRMPNASDIRRQQIEEAARLALSCQAAAEHHQALATMYRARVRRLEQEEAQQAQQMEVGYAR